MFIMCCKHYVILKNLNGLINIAQLILLLCQAYMFSVLEYVYELQLVRM